MLWVVAAGVVDMGLHVCNVHPLPPATDQHLNLLLVEHAHPVVSHHLEEAPPEGFTAGLDLVVQAVVCHPVDVLHHILGCDCLAAAAGH